MLTGSGIGGNVSVTLLVDGAHVGRPPGGRWPFAFSVNLLRSLLSSLVRDNVRIDRHLSLGSSNTPIT